jgi:hypothetical protein
MAIIHRTANGKALTTILRVADNAVLNERGVAGRGPDIGAVPLFPLIRPF